MHEGSGLYNVCLDSMISHNCIALASISSGIITVSISSIYIVADSTAQRALKRALILLFIGILSSWPAFINERYPITLCIYNNIIQ